MPVSTSSPPITFSTISRWRRKRAIERHRRLDRERGNEKRNAEPSGINRQQARALAPTVSFDAATARIAARIGPMHGVQPNANASPIT